MRIWATSGKDAFVSKEIPNLKRQVLGCRHGLSGLSSVRPSWGERGKPAKPAPIP